jgi:hypothetical protein
MIGDSGRAQPHSRTWRNSRRFLKSAAASWSAAVLCRFQTDVNSTASLLALLAVLLSTGCAHRARTYATTDEFWASGVFPVPREFRNGTASSRDVDAWCSSLLHWDESTQYPPLQSLKVDIDGDGVPELFVCQPAHAGTGGNAYLAFREGAKGFRYLGRLGFGGIRAAPADHKGRARVLTSWHISAASVGITLLALTPEGFRQVTARDLSAGDGGDAEGNRLYALLFESETLTEEAVHVVFGAKQDD